MRGKGGRPAQTYLVNDAQHKVKKFSNVVGMPARLRLA